MSSWCFGVFFLHLNSSFFLLCVIWSLKLIDSKTIDSNYLSLLLPFDTFSHTLNYRCRMQFRNGSFLLVLMRHLFSVEVPLYKFCHIFGPHIVFVFPVFLAVLGQLKSCIFRSGFMLLCVDHWTWMVLVDVKFWLTCGFICFSW